MSCWALVALKSSTQAKGRLAEILDQDQRRQLVETMFEHVIAALAASRHLEGIAVVTNETLAHPGVLCLPDPQRGLNPALTAGAAALSARGVDELLVMHADLPKVTSAEIDRLIESGRKGDVAIAADKHGQGTNGLYLRLPAGFAFQFGPDSLRLHLSAIESAGLRVQRLDLPGLAFDVDDPADLASWQAETKLS